MNSKTSHVTILRDETLRETVSHGSNEFPFAYYYEDIWDFDFHCIDWHWHPEFEFVYVESGITTVTIGTVHFEISAGEALFINSQIIHRFEADEHVHIPNIVFSPELLAVKHSLIYKKYISPIIHADIPYLIFQSDVPWQREVISLLKNVFALQSIRDEFEVTIRLLQLWKCIFMNVEIPLTSAKDKPATEKQVQLQIMMSYIHEHYQEAVTLDEIAGSVLISKSGALKMFAQYLNISPIAYLLRYRLQMAAKLLTTTGKSVTVVAESTGFRDPAYFCRKFKELYGVKPSEYRRGGETS